MAEILEIKSHLLGSQKPVRLRPPDSEKDS
jgi:hypothetical protein